MEEIHNLLKRQVRKNFNSHLPASSEMQNFLQDVNGAYRESDNDRAMLERSLELSSQELIRANSQMLKVREIALGIESRETLKDVLGFVVDSVRDFPGILFVMVQKLDESKKNIVTPYYSHFHNNILYSTLKMLGFDLQKQLGTSPTSKKLQFPLAKLKIAQDYLANPRVIIKDSLAELLDGVWPKVVCETIQRVSKFKKFVIVPLFIEGKSWGNLLFFLDSHVSQDILEMIAAHCSFGIKNVLMIESLHKHNLQLAKANKKIQQASDKMKTQKELIDRILATTLNAVLVVDNDNTVILANQAFNNIFRVNEIQEKSLFDIIPNEELAEPIMKVRMGKASNNTHEFRHKISGHERIFFASILQMGRGEILLTFTDVTEERETQERLYLTDRLASVGEMAAGVAHELNNPLTGIIGLAEMLLGQEMPDETKEDIKAISSEAQRSAEIVKNLLTFARKHAPTKKSVQINTIIKDVLKLRAYEHKVNNITIITHFDNSLPKIMADQFQMQQVFLNIVLNAEQAMIETHKHGTLTITTERADNYVKLLFSDDGPGISPENLRKLFTPFFTTKEVGKGTGLGMSICYGIVTNHNGKIYAQSELGKGATFIIELPIDNH